MPGFAGGAGFPSIRTRMSVADALALHAYIIDLERTSTLLLLPEPRERL